LISLGKLRIGFANDSTGIGFANDSTGIGFANDSTGIGFANDSTGIGFNCIFVKYYQVNLDQK